MSSPLSEANLGEVARRAGGGNQLSVLTRTPLPGSAGTPSNPPLGGETARFLPLERSEFGGGGPEGRRGPQRRAG